MPHAGRIRYQKAGNFRKVTAEELRNMESWKMRDLTAEDSVSDKEKKERE